MAVVFLMVAQNSFAGEKQADPEAENQRILVAQSTDDEDDVNDPLETVNRAIFQFNEFFQAVLLNPVAELYNQNLPAVFRTGVRNFLVNLATPVTVANQILQGEPEQALLSVGKFMTNTVVGIGGIADVSRELGHPVKTEDFGQTLGVWGVNEGFYLVLPIFGPSNPRDAIGKFVVDPYFDATGNWIS
ncbi:MAG: VacJ family lipoprotein, partial [Rhodospirillales bacterium]|nr:VacJ family lipoprotein [Rhodospirillales bacterium]